MSLGDNVNEIKHGIQQDPQFQEYKTFVERNAKNIAIAAGVVVLLVVVKKRRSGKAALKAAQELAEASVTLIVGRDQVALMQATEATVLYDTPMGQLLLAAVPTKTS